MKKISRITISLAITIIIITSPLLYSTLDFRFGPDIRFNSKQIDPKMPNFDESEFHFADYNDYYDLVYVLSSIAPPGSSRADFESLLKLRGEELKFTKIPSADGGSDYLDSNSYQIIYEMPRLYNTYCFLSSGGDDDRFIATYDNNDKLISFYINSGCGLISQNGEIE